MVVGPFFLDEKTVTQANFLKMLNKQIIPAIREKQPDIRFQLDGAPPHWSLVVRERLDTAFPGRWIGRDGPVSWSARLPDLTQLDFFLWGYVKTQVFTDEV